LKEELHKYMLKDIDLREPEFYIKKALNTLDDDFMYKSKKQFYCETSGSCGLILLNIGK
jgi:hypothetical protein